MLDPKLESSSHDQTRRHLSRTAVVTVKTLTPFRVTHTRVPQHPCPFPGNFSKPPLETDLPSELPALAASQAPQSKVGSVFVAPLLQPPSSPDQSSL